MTMNKNSLLSMTRILMVLAASAVLGSGCAGYKLGSMLPDDVKSVAVPTFINQTEEPLIEIDTTQATIEEFQRDGSLKVVSEEDADAVLKVVLLSYKLEPISYRKDRRTAAEQYRIRIICSIDMRRTSDNSVVAEHPRVEGEAVFDVFGDLSSSKLRANPDAAEDLAHDIVEKVVETW